jgi:UDP-N-acetylmuramate--alanine ligase
VIVGTQVKDFDHNLRLGQSKYFVVEACEYRGHMLLLQSNYQILTNLEADHLDYYKDLADIIEHFDRFIAKLEDKNNLIINLDNPPLAKLSEKYGGRTYAIDQPAFIQAKNIVVKDGRQFFDLFRANENLGTLELRLPGKFNIYNALAAITAADSLGVKFSVYQKVLRNLAVVGGGLKFWALCGGGRTTVISDYAHHPTRCAQ